MPQKLSIFNLKVLHSFSIWPFPPLNWIHCGICGEKEAQLSAQIVNWTSNIESEPHDSFISLNNFHFPHWIVPKLVRDEVSWWHSLIRADLRRWDEEENNLFVFTFCIFNNQNQNNQGQSSLKNSSSRVPGVYCVSMLLLFLHHSLCFCPACFLFDLLNKLKCKTQCTYSATAAAALGSVKKN